MAKAASRKTKWKFKHCSQKENLQPFCCLTLPLPRPFAASLSLFLWTAADDRYWAPSWIWLTHCRTLSWPGKLARYHRRHRWQHRCCRRCWVWWSGLPGLSTECWLKTAGSPEQRMSFRLAHDGLSLSLSPHLSLPLFISSMWECSQVAQKSGQIEWLELVSSQRRRHKVKHVQQHSKSYKQSRKKMQLSSINISYI